MKINLPNQITLARLVLAFIFFGVLSQFQATDLDTYFLLPIAFWLFLAASLSDFLDGYLARRLKQVTSFGRIVDPVVDKVMVCGAFLFFAGPGFLDYQARPTRNISDVAVWMALVILLRELLVSAIRSHSESQGQDFGASWVGKIKMTVQSTTVCVILGQLAWFPGEDYPLVALLRTTCVWLTVIFTALSIISYVRRAQEFLFSREALYGTPADDDQTAAPDAEQSQSDADAGEQSQADAAPAREDRD